MADTFEDIANWLQSVALLDASMDELVEGLSTHLMDAGVPVARISLGRLLMHPVIGLVDVTWYTDTKTADWSVFPRSAIGPALFDKSPFGDLLYEAQSVATSLSQLQGLDLVSGLSELPFIHDNLSDPKIREKYPLYKRLAESGITGYVAFSAPFGLRSIMIGEDTTFFRGATLSYATRRKSGFTKREVDGFRRIKTPLMATIRVVTEQFFVSELMEAYLGRISGGSVLSGQIARGDVQQIDCALFYSDMRGSTELSQQLSPEDYVAALNRYFDCVAGAVLEHGGEVLKFIGDGLLAIFPFENADQTPEDMCAAALAAARAAFERRNELAEGDVVKFGVALHAGEVVFGNVGTEKRLDFTVIGSAVAKVSRLEEMTRTLASPLLATNTFAARVSDAATRLGTYPLRGFDEDTEIVAYEP